MPPTPVATACTAAVSPSQTLAPQLLLGVDHFLDMARSATNVIGNSVATAAVSAWDGQLRTEDEVNAELLQAVGTGEPETPNSVVT